MKSLATAVLIGGSLLASTGAMASVSGGTVAVATGAGLVNNPGSSCEAYNAGQEELLIANYSSLGATSQVWTHCPIGSPLLFDPAAAGISINLEMPISTTSTVYNCYVAQQGLSSSSAAGTNRTVVWGRNSGVGAAAVGFGTVVTTAGHRSGVTGNNANVFPFTGFTAGLASTVAGTAVVTNYTYTSGCLLNTGDQLHSVQMNGL